MQETDQTPNARLPQRFAVLVSRQFNSCCGTVQYKTLNVYTGTGNASGWAKRYTECTDDFRKVCNLCRSRFAIRLLFFFFVANHCQQRLQRKHAEKTPVALVRKPEQGLPSFVQARDMIP